MFCSQKYRLAFSKALPPWRTGRTVEDISEGINNNRKTLPPHPALAYEKHSSLPLPGVALCQKAPCPRLEVTLCLNAVFCKPRHMRCTF